jgi:hypothetical protein
MILKNRVSILFLHYNRSDVTLENFERIKKYNPTKNIHPVGFDGCDLIEGSHVVTRTDDIYPNNNIFLNRDERPISWYEADILIYDFYRSNPKLPVYFVLEWDTYCNCSLEDYYGDKLYLNNFGHAVRINEGLLDWYWYNQLNDEQKTMENLAGLGPTSCLMFNNQVLSAMVNRITSNPRKYDNMFSEVRLGTLVQQSGFQLNQIDKESVSWREDIINFDKNQFGYYHPVKNKIM